MVASKVVACKMVACKMVACKMVGSEVTRRETLDVLDTLGQRDTAILLESLASARQERACAETAAAEASASRQRLESALAGEGDQERARLDAGTAQVADLMRSEAYAQASSERLRLEREREARAGERLAAALGKERTLEATLSEAGVAEAARRTGRERLLREERIVLSDAEDEAAAEAVQQRGGER